MSDRGSESENPAGPSPTPKQTRPRTNLDWWPNQRNLQVLQQHSPRSGPMGEDFDVVYAAPSELPSDQRMIKPADLYEWVLQNVPDDAQAVTVGGNGFRAVGVIEALENELGRPVLTANQVLLWAALAAAGAQPGLVNGYGRIFGLPLTPPKGETESSQR